MPTLSGLREALDIAARGQVEGRVARDPGA